MVTAIPIILSAIALIFSVFVFAESRRRYKEDVFLKINELMISEDQNRGRQILHRTYEDGVPIDTLSSSERANVSRAMAMYETLGLYLSRGYLIKDDVIQMWGSPAFRAWPQAQKFVARRKGEGGILAYPYFRYLAERGEEYVKSQGHNE